MASAEELLAASLAADRGREIYDYDQAAWHTTDTMHEDIADLENSGIRDWVVTRASDGWLVTYWKPQEDSYSAVYSALWTGKRVRNRTVLRGDATVLNPEQLAQIAATRAASQGDLTRCSDYPFNTVTIPGPGADSYFVYLLTPQTSTQSIPAGGHYRFTVRGGEVVDQRKFTNSCLEIGFAPPDKDSKAVAMVVSHLLDPVPTEIHVFSMFAAGTPVYVATMPNNFFWLIERVGDVPKISLIDRVGG